MSTEWVAEWVGRHRLGSILKCDQQTQGRPGWCRRPGNGRFVYGEWGGIKRVEPGREKTSWIRVRAMCTAEKC